MCAAYLNEIVYDQAVLASEPTIASTKSQPDYCQADVALLLRCYDSPSDTSLFSKFSSCPAQIILYQLTWLTVPPTGAYEVNSKLYFLTYER